VALPVIMRFAMAGFEQYGTGAKENLEAPLK